MEVEIVRHGNGTIERWMSAVEFREMLLHLTPEMPHLPNLKPHPPN